MAVLSMNRTNQTQTWAVSHITGLQTHSQKLHARNKTQATVWEPCSQPVDRQHGGNNQGPWLGISSREETWKPWSWPTGSGKTENVGTERDPGQDLLQS